jgi:Uma2 family endonuclease
MMNKVVGVTRPGESFIMSTVSLPTSLDGRVLLYGVAWDEYTRLLRAFAERPSVRLTYDRGVLEIMTPLFRHDHPARFIGRMITALTEELDLPIACGGSTTLRRRPRKRGLEPDECFWIANEPRVRSLERLNLRTDPPPDLAVEIDVTSSSLNRMAIYAALGVPEVWRLDAAGLTFHLLQADSTYGPATLSRSFPSVSAADISHFLALLGKQEENELLRQFRTWVRQRRGEPPAS